VARVLLLLPTTTYRTGDFLRAAAALNVDVTVASEEPSTFEESNREGLLTLDFRNPSACAEAAAAFAGSHPIGAVIGVDEDTSVVAAAIADRLGLPHNPASAAAAAGDKARMRDAFARGGVPSPAHRVFSLAEDPARVARAVSFPCVLKPTFLAASRGVIRADDPAAFERAWGRIAAILAEPDVRQRGGERAELLLVEDFIPGREVALEGLLRAGRLHVLALFDKPDPLDGPFFEETIYVTPSRLPDRAQREIARAAERGAAALGLREGPVHAELRVNEEGVWVIEIAARSIGGLCARTLRFGAGLSLEELILRHALGSLEEVPARDPRAAGVMMIPIPAAGVFERVNGLEGARRVPGVEDIVISAHPGQKLVPLPEGSRYLGFLFARGDTPDQVEAALRQAHARLDFVIVAPRIEGGDPSLRAG